MAFELGNDVSAVDSVPTALFCYLRGVNGHHDNSRDHGDDDDDGLQGVSDHSNVFERVLVTALRMGGDTDTIASMACR